MIRLITIIFIILWGCAIANAQTAEPPDTASLVRAFNKVMTENDAYKAQAAADARLIAALEAEIRAVKAQVEAEVRLNEVKDKYIERLIQTKCQQTKLVFGLLSWRRCY